MRNWGLAALVAAMAISNAASAAGGSPVPAGLIDGNDAAQASLVVIDRPGVRIAPNVRLRLDLSDRLRTIAHGIAPTNTNLIDIRKHRHSGMMVDYFPASDSGFFFSAGFRKSPARARWAPGGASNSVQIFAPTTVEPLRVVTNIARRAPTVTAGWSGMIGEEASIGFSAGAMQQHGRAARITSAGLQPVAGNNARWSRTGGVAQVNLAVRF